MLVCLRNCETLVDHILFLNVTKKVTSISLRRYRSTALKESILSNSDIFDTSFSMSTFMRACLQSLCCSCSAAARLCRNQGMKLGPSRNLLLKMRNISHASSICQQLMKKPSKFLHEKKKVQLTYTDLTNWISSFWTKTSLDL